MPLLRPFRGIRYDPRRARLKDVVAPPYDVISPEYQATLYASHPHNIVRLILGRESDRYAEAAGAFEAWQKEGVLVRDESPSFYLLHQRFRNEQGGMVTRKGFVGLCRLEEFDKKVILPHEKTLSKPREDRLKLFKATNANFSQVFGLYSDPSRAIDKHLGVSAGHEPDVQVSFENVENEVWMVNDPAAIQEVVNGMKDKQVLIADGHHRYETALTYRDWKRSANDRHTGDESYNYVMMFFTNLEDEGLVIYPTHRVVHSVREFEGRRFLKKLEALFSADTFDSLTGLQHALREAGASAFGLALQEIEGFRLLRLKQNLAIEDLIPDDLPAEVKKLDVALLHHSVLRDMLGISMDDQEKKLNIRYVQGIEQAAGEVRSGRGQAAFLLNPTGIEQVRAVANGGYTMPQKSTFFYPKLLSGLVLNKMD